MNITEFSYEFDILYNNIMSNIAPGLNEYEKSVFLTQAQEALVTSVYNGEYNGDSFEETEEVRRYIGELVRDWKTSTPYEGLQITGLSPNSYFYQLPKSTTAPTETLVWFVTYEAVKWEDEKAGCLNGSTVLVKPVTQDDYFSTSRNPFKIQNDRRVLRLDLNDNIVELISNYQIGEYHIRYIEKPEPIILEDLSSYGVTINGKQNINECKLNPVIHRAILRKAVELAKAAWASGNQSV